MIDPTDGRFAYSLRYALKRAAAGLKTRDRHGRTYRLTVKLAAEFTERLFEELTREARMGSIRLAGGTFKIAKRKPRHAVLGGKPLELPATKRAMWRGPRL